jgi:hypothetical protein
VLGKNLATEKWSCLLKIVEKVRTQHPGAHLASSHFPSQRLTIPLPPLPPTLAFHINEASNLSSQFVCSF